MLDDIVLIDETRNGVNARLEVWTGDNILMRHG